MKQERWGVLLVPRALQWPTVGAAGDRKTRRSARETGSALTWGLVGAMEIFLQEEKDSGQFFRKVSGFGASPLPES